MMKENELITETVHRYGKEFLMYHCQSLSHRILKTPVNNRTMKVQDFIEKCISYANRLIPGQAFEPRKVFKIKIAEQFDDSTLGRSIFKLYKKASNITGL
jgi:hypothetical protein